MCQRNGNAAWCDRVLNFMFTVLRLGLMYLPAILIDALVLISDYVRRIFIFSLQTEGDSLEITKTADSVLFT